MAVADSTERFNKLRSLLNVSTASILGTSKRGLPCCLDSNQMVIQAANFETDTLPEWSAASRGAKALAVANTLFEAHFSLIGSHAAFVQAAVTWLDNMSPLPSLSSASIEAEILYRALFDTLLVHQALPISWPTKRYMLKNPQLYSALNTLAKNLCSMPPPTSSQASASFVT